MTRALQEAFAAVSKLPNDQQDAIAEIVLLELASDARWAEAFGRSQGALSKLAEAALDEYRGGATEALDPDAL